MSNKTPILQGVDRPKHDYGQQRRIKEFAADAGIEDYLRFQHKGIKRGSFMIQRSSGYVSGYGGWQKQRSAFIAALKAEWPNLIKEDSYRERFRIARIEVRPTAEQLAIIANGLAKSRFTLLESEGLRGYVAWIERNDEISIILTDGEFEKILIAARAKQAKLQEVRQQAAEVQTIKILREAAIAPDSRNLKIAWVVSFEWKQFRSLDRDGLNKTQTFVKPALAVQFVKAMKTKGCVLKIADDWALLLEAALDDIMGNGLTMATWDMSEGQVESKAVDEAQRRDISIEEWAKKVRRDIHSNGLEVSLIDRRGAQSWFRQETLGNLITACEKAGWNIVGKNDWVIMTFYDLMKKVETDVPEGNHEQLWCITIDQLETTFCETSLPELLELLQLQDEDGAGIIIVGAPKSMAEDEIADAFDKANGQAQEK